MVDDREAFREIGIRLQVARELAGSSRVKLAYECGVSAAAWSNYEAGHRKIPANLIVRAAQLLGCTSAFLLGEETPEKYRGAVDYLRERARIASLPVTLDGSSFAQPQASPSRVLVPA